MRAPNASSACWRAPLGLTLPNRQSTVPGPKDGVYFASSWPTAYPDRGWRRDMALALQDDPTLDRFRAALADTHGARLERVMLYRSRARGDARPDSDYDIAVFLRDMEDRPRERNRLADLATDILYDGGGLVHAMPYRAGAYNEPTPPMEEIRADGIDLRSLARRRSSKSPSTS